MIVISSYWVEFNPLVHSVHYIGRLIKILILEEILKKFLWASRLWVGRRKDPVLSYVMKKKDFMQ